MTERALTVKLMEAFRSLRGAIIIKHADRTTSGIPDLSVSWGETNWFEVKYQRKGDTLKDIFKGRALQIVFCAKLAHATNRRCWCVIYQDEPQRTVIWEPDAIYSNIRYPDSQKGPVDVTDTEFSIVPRLRAYGAISVTGWNHLFPVTLLRKLRS